MTRFFTILVLFLSFASLDSKELSNNQTTPEDLVPRIRKLIPKGWLEFPYIEPAIPMNYRAGCYAPENFDDATIALWGTEEDLEILRKDPLASPHTSGVIVATHSTIVQTGKDSFSGENDLCANLSKLGFEDLKIKKLRWGNYPVQSLEGRDPRGILQYLAIVGLNSNGWTICFAYRPAPEQEIAKSSELWNTFIQQSRELEEWERFAAHGMDMKDGYTIFTLGTASLKVNAEKRKPDGKSAVLITPMSPHTTFKIEKVERTYMGSKWKYLEPCVKVHGVLEENGDKTSTIANVIITILIKDAEEFSFDINQESNTNNVVIF